MKRNAEALKLIGAGLAVAVLVTGCGRYEQGSERRTVTPATAPIDQRATVIRCADAPRVPEDNPQVSVDRTKTKVTIGWVARGWPGFTVLLDDPTCRDRPDLDQWLKPVGPFPRFENASIVVQPGIECAYVAYTLYGDGEGFWARLEDITAVRPDGRSIDWKHQTATGGPSDIGAPDGRQIVTPGGEECGVDGGGDADYFDARDVTVGETVQVTFRFVDVPHDSDDKSTLQPERVVEVPFKVVSPDSTRR